MSLIDGSCDALDHHSFYCPQGTLQWKLALVMYSSILVSNEYEDCHHWDIHSEHSLRTPVHDADGVCGFHAHATRRGNGDDHDADGADVSGAL